MGCLPALQAGYQQGSIPWRSTSNVANHEGSNPSGTTKFCCYVTLRTLNLATYYLHRCQVNKLLSVGDKCKAIEPAAFEAAFSRFKSYVPLPIYMHTLIGAPGHRQIRKCRNCIGLHSGPSGGAGISGKTVRFRYAFFYMEAWQSPVYCSSLENCRRASVREFESHRFRQVSVVGYEHRRSTIRLRTRFLRNAGWMLL